MLFFTSNAVAQTIPSGAIKKGSFANQKLIKDTMIGVAVSVSKRGCSQPEKFVPFVLQLPQGEAGSRYWEEIWVVTGCSQEYPVTIEFAENGLNAASWTIQSPKQVFN